MTEQFANNASSTLNGAINNSTTTIVVTSATSFPSVGNFRLLIGTNPATAEIVIVTSVSGTTFTVIRGQEGTTASSWPDLTTVTHILTFGAVEALRANLRRDKPLHISLDTVNSSQDGYSLTWLNSDGYWAARPGSPFTISGNELNTTRTLSIDGYGTFTSAHFNPQLYINGGVLTSASYSVGEIPLTSLTYDYLSDGYQSFTVPTGVTQLLVKMWGPGGGTGNYNSGYGGASGGYSAGFLSVTPGETLVLAVGSGGKKSVSSTGNGGVGGWPSGGSGGRGDASAGGGGGLTGVFSTSYAQANALMIAGGGGGSSGYTGGLQPGAGGGSSGNDGNDTTSGKGGTQIFGGFGGTTPAVYNVTSTTGGTYEVGTTDLNHHTDDSLLAVSLPFAFVFYGVSYTSLNVSSNAFVNFNTSDNTYAWDIPGTARPPTIALWNRDNDTRNAGFGWYTKIVGSFPNRIFVLEYRGYQLNTPSLTINAELKLYEGSTTFEVLYSTSTATATDGTIGIQNNLGVYYTVFNNNQAPPAAGTRLVYDVTATIVGKPLSGGSAFTDVTTSTANDAGGGGSGYWGGGAGQGDGRMGGGGSGYLHPIRVTGGTTTAGTNGAIGAVGGAPPNITDTSYAAGVGVGGAATGTGSDGGNGRVVISYGNSSNLGTNALTFGNNSSITAPIGFSDLYLNTSSGGSVVLNPSSGLVTLQGTSALNSTTDLILSFTNSLRASSSSSNKFRVFSTGAVNIGEGTNNDTSAEAQAGLTGPLINISSGTGSITSVTNQATIFNQSGALNLQGNTDVRFNTGTTLRGYFDTNGIFRTGPSATTTVTMQGVSWPQSGTDYYYQYNSSGSSWAEIVAGGNSNRAALQVMNSGPGGSATAGVSLYAAGTSHATAEYNGNGVIEQSGATTSGLIFTKITGAGASFASTGAIWQSGAWAIGRATNNDTSAEAQAGLTGPLINISAATGTFSSVANQALNFNIAGAHHIQGHTEVRFDIGTALAGYFDSNTSFRIGPNASTTVTKFTSDVLPDSNTESFYSYNASSSNVASVVSGSTASRSIIEALNTGAGTTSTVGLRVMASGTTEAVTAFAGNGVMEQHGASTSAVVFSKTLGDGTSRATTGRIYQSGAWVIGESTQNDTSSEAQAGLTGPLLNLTQITSGTLSTVANQALLYNSAGTAILQGNVGHSFIASTTTVASTSTTKFITNVGRRIKTNVQTANYPVTTSDEVIIVGTITGSITITLPASPIAGDIYRVKDQLGNAATFNIIVAGNGNNIDGQSSYTMNTNYESITVVFANGTWSIV